MEYNIEEIEEGYLLTVHYQDNEEKYRYRKYSFDNLNEVLEFIPRWNVQ